MPFVTHADVGYNNVSYSRGTVVSDALGALLAVDHPALLTRVQADPDLIPVDIPAPVPAPAPAPVAAPAPAQTPASEVK